jgi:hypothetical protein
MGKFVLLSVISLFFVHIFPTPRSQAPSRKAKNHFALNHFAKKISDDWWLKT